MLRAGGDLERLGPLTLIAGAVAARDCGNTTDCSLSIFGGFSGSDRHSVSFTTEMQLSKINEFAISTYFFNALAQVSWLWINTLNME